MSDEKISGTDRDKLKDLFKTGSRPTEDSFAKLIDSMLNLNDENTVVSLDGLKLARAGVGPLLKFSNSKDGAWWNISLGAKNSLNIASLGNSGCVGINKAEPKTALDVNGTITSNGLMVNGVLQFEAKEFTARSGTSKYDIISVAKIDMGRWDVAVWCNDPVIKCFNIFPVNYIRDDNNNDTKSNGNGLRCLLPSDDFNIAIISDAKNIYLKITGLLLDTPRVIHYSVNQLFVAPQPG